MPSFPSPIQYSVSYLFSSFYSLNPNPTVWSLFVFVCSCYYYLFCICSSLFVPFSLFVPAPLITSYVDYIKEFWCQRGNSPAFGSSPLPGNTLGLTKIYSSSSQTHLLSDLSQVLTLSK